MTERRKPDNEPLRRLVITGSMMAAQLHLLADALDRSSGVDPERIERRLSQLWDQVLLQFRRATNLQQTDANSPPSAAAQGIGACEICGTIDHHLVGGLCAYCKQRCSDLPREYGAPLGAEADVSHVLGRRR